MTNSNNIQTKEIGSVVVFELPEVLDYPAVHKVRDIITKYIDVSKSRIILDFKNVKDINSTGLGIIISRLRRSRESGGDIKILNPNKEIQKIIEIMGADKIFDIVSTVEEGIGLFDAKIE